MQNDCKNMSLISVFACLKTTVFFVQAISLFLNFIVM